MESIIPYELVDIIYQYEGRSLPGLSEINKKVTKGNYEHFAIRTFV